MFSSGSRPPESFLEKASAVEDHQRHKRDQDLGTGVECAVQNPGENAEYSKQQEKEAVSAEVFSRQTGEDGIQADKGQSHAVLVEQQIVHDRIWGEEFQHKFQRRAARIRAVLQQDQRGGKEQSR